MMPLRRTQDELKLARRIEGTPLQGLRLRPDHYARLREAAYYLDAGRPAIAMADDAPARLLEARGLLTMIRAGGEGFWHQLQLTELGREAMAAVFGQPAAGPVPAP